MLFFNVDFAGMGGLLLRSKNFLVMKNCKKQNFRIVHRAVEQLHNGESAAPGVAQAVVNMREREQALEVVGEPRQVAQLEAGDRVLLVDDDRTIVLRSGSVVWGQQVIVAAETAVIGAHRVGPLLVVVTAGGNVVLHRTATGYERTDVEGAMPQLHLAAVEHTTLTATVPAYEFASPYSRWQAPLQASDVDALSRIVGNAVATLGRNAVSQGRFTGVMLVRYGVRLWDDSYLWLSQPVMVGHHLVRASYRTTATVTSSGSSFTGIEPVDIGLDCYRLGISVASGIDERWRELVKAIDVLATPQSSVASMDSGMDYRCAVTTTSGTRRYLLELGPKPRATGAMLETMLAGKWRVVASTASLDGSSMAAAGMAVTAQQVVPGVVCYAVTSPRLTGPSVSHQECASVMEWGATSAAGAVTMEHNGRLYQVPTAFALKNRWPVLPWLDGGLSAGTSVATVQVTLSTSSGDVTLTKTMPCPCGATMLNPFIAFHDTRATHIAIAVGGKVWQGHLAPLEGTGVAACIGPSFSSHALEAGSLPGGGGEVAVVPSQGTLVVSAVGNSLVTEWRAQVSGATIMALGAACRPIYSGGFGRYPIYLFTSEGIMALPQSTTGKYGEPRLIAQAVIADRAVPVAGADALWFVDHNGFLCSIAGSKLRRWMSGAEALWQLAWNDKESELWIVDDAGKAQVLMPSGRTHRRTLELTNLYSDPRHALAVGMDGSLLDLSHEQASMLATSYLSQPFEIDPLMRSVPKAIVWNIYPAAGRGDAHAAAHTATLSLRGERGRGCLGYLISQVNASGVIAAPIARPLLVPPSRTLRLEVTGTLATGTQLLPTQLLFK